MCLWGPLQEPARYRSRQCDARPVLLPLVVAGQSLLMEKAGMTRGAADSMYSPNWGISEA